MRLFIVFCAAVLMWISPAVARDLSALARVDAAASKLFDRGRDTVLELQLGQPLPYRVFTLDAPRRLVVDFSEVDWAGFDPAALGRSTRISALRAGVLQPGWSRMVVDLAQPMALKSAVMQTGGAGARLQLVLGPSSAADFAALAGAPADALARQRPARQDLPPAKQRQTGEGKLTVVLDPGHGGIDPGAERDGLNEADLMLTFARELQEMLLRAGRFNVVLTREADVFVSLEQRLSIARAAGADVFISLHADALAEGHAEGATVYTLSETASDAASQLLAERHDRADLLAGMDLSAQDDVVAGILMDLARLETEPRSERLAHAVVDTLSPVIAMHKRPRQTAGFSVLRAPDMPSVLIELGYMSSARDLASLRDPGWRAKTAWAIRDALLIWAAEDAAEARLLRK